MEKKYYSLGPGENNSLVKITRILFGAVCIAVAVFWLIFNIKSINADGTLWITIIFLSGFGFYQIWSGIGRAKRFIEIGQNIIRLKKNSILPVQEFSADNFEKIEIFPLNLIFFLKHGKPVIMRFGTTYTDIIEPVKNGIISFATRNNILCEIKNEEF
jgi:hypothetical protein